VARLLGFVLWHGCNPFRRPDPEVALYRRLRPRGVLLSWALLAAAVGWNLAHWKETRRGMGDEGASHKRAANSPEAGLEVEEGQGEP
ncbi:MAG: hypothetical protein ACE5LX_06575, partial [Nitrospinota bacterium]